MKHSPRSSGTPSSLSESVHHRLNMYALAASAAGVGVLALARTSEAKIVYTPANQTIANKIALNLDLNHDGTPDFSFYLSESIFREARGPSPFGDAVLRVTALQSDNQVLGVGTFRKQPNASALPPGAEIGPKRKFSPGRHLMATTNYGCSATTCNGSSGGRWKEASRRYLGLKFIIKGKIHYGWARLTVDADWGHRIQATLTGYAYETVPNKSIVAGKTKGPTGNDEAPIGAAFRAPAARPAGLGSLALGASAASVWRRQSP